MYLRTVNLIISTVFDLLVNLQTVYILGKSKDTEAERNKLYPPNTNQFTRYEFILLQGLYKTTEIKY